MKNITFLSLIVLLMLSLSSQLHAQDCDQGSNITQKIWNKGNPGLSSTAQKVGPRSITFRSPERGRIAGTGGQLFVTPNPLNTDKVTIRIKELDGKGQTRVVICKVNKRNRSTQVAERVFNDTTKRKNIKDEKRTIEVTGVNGHLLKINFDGKSATNTFQYEVQMSK